MYLNSPTWKGGEGSGPEEGHPFRGNRWTGGIGGDNVKTGSGHLTVGKDGKGTYHGTVYRGGDLRIDSSGTFGEGYYFTSEKEVAIAYALPKEDQVVSYAGVTIPGLLIAESFNSVVDPVRQSLNDNKGYTDLKKMGRDIKEYYESKGYSGIAYSEHLRSAADTIVLFNKPSWALSNKVAGVNKFDRKRIYLKAPKGRRKKQDALRFGGYTVNTSVSNKDLRDIEGWPDGEAKKEAGIAAKQVQGGEFEGIVLRQSGRVVAIASCKYFEDEDDKFLGAWRMGSDIKGGGTAVMYELAKKAVAMDVPLALEATENSIPFYKGLGMTQKDHVFFRWEVGQLLSFIYGYENPQVAKGGAGSGPEEGHPFYGNRWTGGISEGKGKLTDRQQASAERAFTHAVSGSKLSLSDKAESALRGYKINLKGDTSEYGVMNVSDSRIWLNSSGREQKMIATESQNILKGLPNYNPDTGMVHLYRGEIPGKPEGGGGLQSWSISSREGSIASAYSHGVKDWLKEADVPLSSIVAIPELAFKGWSKEMRDSYRDEFEVVIRTPKGKTEKWSPNRPGSKVEDQNVGQDKEMARYWPTGEQNPDLDESGRPRKILIMPIDSSSEFIAHKGGEGSGPEEGHAFRGNRFTGPIAGEGRGSLDRAQRAKETYKPCTRDIRQAGLANQTKLANAIKGKEIPDNAPFDVVRGKDYVEVKTIVRGTNDKITMHPESLARKEKEVKETGGRAHTVVFDNRDGKIYYKDGLGSFRLGNMQQVSMKELKGILR